MGAAGPTRTASVRASRSAAHTGPEWLGASLSSLSSPLPSPALQRTQPSPLPRPPTGKAQVYKFASSALNLSIKGALDPFYTANAECNPGGPQFDLPFFLSWSAALGSVAGLLGVIIFQKVLSRTFYRRAFWTTTVLQVASAIVDIAIVQRWNIRAGISDKLFYLLGDSIVVEVVRLERGGGAPPRVRSCACSSGGRGRAASARQCRAAPHGRRLTDCQRERPNVVDWMGCFPTPRCDAPRVLPHPSLSRRTHRRSI